MGRNNPKKMNRRKLLQTTGVAGSYLLGMSAVGSATAEDNEKPLENLAPEAQSQILKAINSGNANYSRDPYHPDIWITDVVRYDGSKYEVKHKLYQHLIKRIRKKNDRGPESNNVGIQSNLPGKAKEAINMALNQGVSEVHFVQRDTPKEAADMFMHSENNPVQVDRNTFESIKKKSVTSSNKRNDIMISHMNMWTGSLEVEEV